MPRASASITAAFAYNADGLRIRKTVNGTVTDYTLHGNIPVKIYLAFSNWKWIVVDVYEAP